MITLADQIKDSRGKASETNQPEHQKSGESASSITDNRPVAIAQRKLQNTANNSPQVKQLQAIQEKADNSKQIKQLQAIQEKADNSPQVRQLMAIQKKADNYSDRIVQKTEGSEEESLQMKQATVQKMAPEEDGELQMKNNPVQKMAGEEEELQMKEAPLQLMESEEELQMKKGIVQKATQEEVQMKAPIQKSSTGNSMPKDVQAKMESSFGTDFSGVNIHANDESATNMGALAYAQGNDVHFAPGHYDPQSSKGQELLGHELTHVVQQRQGRVQATKQQKGASVNDSPALEQEADVMGKKAAEGKSADVAGRGSGLQKKNNSELLKDLDDRSKGVNRAYKNDSETDKARADEYADQNFQEAYGEVNFAENLNNKINDSVRDAYQNIREGQFSAIEALESSMKSQHEKQEMIRACLISFIGILNAWIPLAAASVKSAESTLSASIAKTLPPNVSLKSVKIPAYASAIKKFGESTIRGPIVTSIASINSLIKTKPQSAKDSVRTETGSLKDKTGFAVSGLVLEMSQNIHDSDKQAVSPRFIADLKSSIYKQVISAIFPDYSSFIINPNSAGIQNTAKTQLLKNIVLSSAGISKGWRTDSIEGNSKKEGSGMVEHALNAMGGQEEFAKTLKNPYEFAFASLNSSLSHFGLDINTSDEVKRKAMETNFLKERKGFHINLKDPGLFKEFLKDKEIVTNNHYKVINGPIKTMKEKHPGKTGGLYSSYTSYMFDYKDVNFSNIEVWVDPADQESMMQGKIVDIKSFSLKFDTTGDSNISERTATRIGRSFKNYGTYPLSGRNEIKVTF